METLVKFCRPEHNIMNGCHTIRFGTLEYYRALDPSFAIADKNEGKESIHVDLFETNTASSEAIEALKPCFSFPLGEDNRPLDKKIRLQGNKIDRTFLNCFIWCCSRAFKPISAIQGSQFDPEYTSFYEIDDAGRFGRRLGELLWNSFIGKSISSIAFVDTATDFIQNLSVKGRQDEIVLDIFHHDVIYVDEKRSVIDEGQIHHPYAESIPVPLRHLFAKSKKYEKDHEHRFVFLFQHKRDGTLEVCKEPVNLPIDPVSRHLIDQTLVADHNK